MYEIASALIVAGDTTDAHNALLVGVQLAAAERWSFPPEQLCQRHAVLAGHPDG